MFVALMLVNSKDQLPLRLSDYRWLMHLQTLCQVLLMLMLPLVLRDLQICLRWYYQSKFTKCVVFSKIIQINSLSNRLKRVQTSLCPSVFSSLQSNQRLWTSCVMWFTSWISKSSMWQGSHTWPILSGIQHSSSLYETHPILFDS